MIASFFFDPLSVLYNAKVYIRIFRTIRAQNRRIKAQQQNEQWTSNPPIRAIQKHHNNKSGPE